MYFYPAHIPEIITVEPQVLGDERGSFAELFRRNRFREAGIGVEFVQENLSRSKTGSLRGLHYQIEHPQSKLIMVPYGRILDVAVDIRRGSPTFGQWVAEELSDRDHRMMYIPGDFAHGFAVLSDSAIVHYKCSDYYHPQGERGIRWDDPRIGIDWPLQSPVISRKDRNLPRLDDLADTDLPVYEPGQ